MNKNLYYKIEIFQNLLIEIATGGSFTANEDDYKQFRIELLEQEAIKDKVPIFIVTNRTAAQFWQFIKNKFKTYPERRNFIWEEFSKSLIYAEQESPTKQKTDSEVETIDLEHRSHILFQIPHNHS